MSAPAPRRTAHPIPRLAARVAGADAAVTTVTTLDPALDCDSGVPVTSTIVVLAAPRTGSSLLVYSLQQLGYGVGREYWGEPSTWEAYMRWGLLRPRWRGVAGQTRRALHRYSRWWHHSRFDTEEFLRYQRLVEQHRTTANGVFVIKLFNGHLQRLRQHNGLTPADVLTGELSWVLVRRGDKIGQSISHFRAKQTGSWLDLDGTSTPAFDPDRVDADQLESIAKRAHGFVRDEQALFELCERRGVTPVIVDYERTQIDLMGVLRDVLDPLGGHAPADLDPPLHRQSDEANAVLRARVLDAHPALADDPRLTG